MHIVWVVTCDNRGYYADGTFARASFSAAINCSSRARRCLWISIASLRIASASCTC